MRTGDEYLAGIHAPRDVWLDGAHVPDVTAEPSFAGCLQTLAQLYDMQHEPAHRDELTFIGDDGDRVGMSFLAPRNQADIRRRHEAVRVWADASCGFMGRSPDYVNAALMAFASAQDWFAEDDGRFGADVRFGENVQSYFEYCRGRDLFLAHASINPQVHRLVPLHKQVEPHVHLRVERETHDGLVLSGAKLIGTSAPLADELLVFPLPGLVPGDEQYTPAFAIPTATPGLRFVCRDAFHSAGSDSPLTQQFDEPDAICVFEEVLVPWNRVFSYGDVERANSLWDVTDARIHTAHQGMVRTIAKANLLVAIAIGLAEHAETDSVLHVQEMLGELLGYVEMTKGAVALSEQEAEQTPRGTWRPAAAPLLALRYHFPRMCSRMVEVIQIVGGASLLIAPGDAQLHGSSDLEHQLEQLFVGATGGTDATTARLALLRLARNATSDLYGQRQMLFERYNAGDPVRLAAQFFKQSRRNPDLREALHTALKPPTARAAEHRLSIQG